MATPTFNVPLPQTLYVGAGHQVCATVHRPVGAINCAVILVEPFGIEALAAESTFRRLTELLLSRGAAVVRFAPPGVGDSGNATGAFVDSWMASVSDVSEFARTLSCDGIVHLVGLRLGATVAAYATARASVDHLVLWAPVAGKAFTREFKLLGAAGSTATVGGAATMDEQVGSAEPARMAVDLFSAAPGDIEAGGFIMSAECVAGLAALDLRTIESVGAERILLVDRDDIGCVDKVHENLRKRAYDATVVNPAGYSDMRLDDPEEGSVPEETLRSITYWLLPSATPVGASDGSSEGASERSATGSRSDVGTSHEAASELRVAVGDAVVIERPVTVIVDGVALAAIVTQAAGPAKCSLPSDQSSVSPQSSPAVLTASTSATTAPAVVFLTTGSNPRCGAGRLQALLARDLARRGHLVVRYDRRGIGLSIDLGADAQPGAVVDAYDAQHGRDLLAVVEYTTSELGASSVVLAGMCSGAYTAFHFVKALSPGGRAAKAVRAIVSMNQIIFLDRAWTTKAESPAMAVKAGYELRTAWRDPRRWKSLLSGGISIRTTALRLTRLVGMRLAQVQTRALVALRLKPQPPLVEALLHIRELGIRQIYIFDEAETGLGQLRIDGQAACSSLEREGWLGIETIAGAGHTFGPTASKRWLSVHLADSLARLDGATP